MEFIFGDISTVHIWMTVAITLFAGIVKGAVGFALPMIMISGLSAFLPPEVALGALILPTMLANGWQAMRGGLTAALSSVKKFRVYILIVLFFIALSAQLVVVLPTRVLFVILGVPISILATLQLIGWRFHIKEKSKRKVEVLFGVFAGFLGGVSGVWGPPTVAYLTATETPKAEQLRVQGVVYGVGAVVLLIAHLKSGVLNSTTAPLSFAMVLPVAIGMVVGLWIHDRMDQDRFRRATLLVLAVAGLNLIRRGVIG